MLVVHSALKFEGKPSNPLIPLASFARFVVPLCLALYLVISNQDFMPMWFFHYANHVVYSIHSGPSEVSENNGRREEKQLYNLLELKEFCGDSFLYERDPSLS